MKQIPKVFANKIDKKLENNTTYFKTSSEDYKPEIEQEKNKRSVEQKIKEIFASPRYVYKAEVEITFADKKIIKKIIGQSNGNLITLDNELIKISDILDIKFVN